MQLNTDDVVNARENSQFGDEEVAAGTQRAVAVCKRLRLPDLVEAVMTVVTTLDLYREGTIDLVPEPDHKSRKRTPGFRKHAARSPSKKKQARRMPTRDQLLAYCFNTKAHPQDPRAQIIRRLLERKTAAAPFRISLSSMLNQIWVDDAVDVWQDLAQVRALLLPNDDLWTELEQTDDRSFEGISEEADPDHLSQADMSD